MKLSLVQISKLALVQFLDDAFINPIALIGNSPILGEVVVNPNIKIGIRLCIADTTFVKSGSWIYVYL